MAFNDLELKIIDKVICEPFRNRVPKEHRDKLRYEVQIEGHDIIISEVRPLFSKPDEWIPVDFAKLKYIRTQKLWKLYWKRASGKWEFYAPKEKAKNLKTLANAIEEDQYGCFFG